MLHTTVSVKKGGFNPAIGVYCLYRTGLPLNLCMLKAKNPRIAQISAHPHVQPPFWTRYWGIMGKMTLSHLLTCILFQRRVVEAYVRCDNVTFRYFAATISRTNSISFNPCDRSLPVATKIFTKLYHVTQGELLQQLPSTKCRSVLLTSVSRPLEKCLILELWTLLSRFCQVKSQRLVG